MNSYQLTLILSSKLSDDKKKTVLSSVSAQFGKLIKEDLWGTKNLSYPINHVKDAYFAHYEFESEPQKIKLLDKNLKSSDDIVRYLLVRK